MPQIVDDLDSYVLDHLWINLDKISTELQCKLLITNGSGAKNLFVITRIRYTKVIQYNTLLVTPGS